MSGTMVTASTPEDSKQPKLTAPSPAQDLHPYARGSVIEVWHVDKQGHDDDWWSEASDEEEEEDESNPRTIRLCDIIDRAPYQGSSWRYYVHYRDFNRRMDEWITIDKIVSPPSVGNAKARALKKEEEMKRKREEQEKQAAAAAQAAEPQRSVRRKAPGSDDGEEGPRRTRLSRRKSTTDGDDPMSDEEHSESDGKKKKTEILAVSGDAVTTQTIGEHVVATVQAQELDEHEGLDDAALKEHEEVTKVKNVGFLELGKLYVQAANKARVVDLSHTWPVKWRRGTSLLSRKSCSTTMVLLTFCMFASSRSPCSRGKASFFVINRGYHQVGGIHLAMRSIATETWPCLR